MATTTSNDTTSPSTPPCADLVIIDWTDLIHDAPTVQLALQKAYDPQNGSSTGILAIRNVPGFCQAKQDFLPLAHTLQQLPADYLQDHLTDEASLYNAGWSHGKEKLKNDAPDLAKGSFYYNPITNVPGTSHDRQQYPLSYPINKWPDKIPGFEQKAKTIGCILKQAVVEVCRHLDALMAQKQQQQLSSSLEYPDQFLYKAMKDTDKVKARLLYYFPLALQNKSSTSTTDNNNDNNNNTHDSWIGWHNDSGFLTALAGDFYLDHSTGQIVDCPDPAAGLYVATGTEGVVQKVNLPADCLAVQLGECAQIVTGGAVRATPHCVRACQHNDNIARCSLPCFVDTKPGFPLSAPPGMEQAVLDADVPNTHVPPLAARWENHMTFGDFLTKTFSLYYNWQEEGAK